MASLSEKENYPLSKMIERFLHLLRAPENVKDNRMFRYTIMLAIGMLLLALLNFISYCFYHKLLLEIEGIFFADGAVSDMMQTTEISYAYIYQLRTALLAGNLAAFDSTFISS
jgi:hypothetical protein